jgi:hypothetical protein
LGCRASVVIALLSLAACRAEAGHPEAWYRDAWCNERQGRAEVVLPDGSRADCVTATHAVEVERSAKWAEALGQSLWYAHQTGLRAGVVLILPGGDRTHLVRLESVIADQGLPVDVWEVEE